MGELPANTVEREGTASRVVAQRRQIAHDVRAVREKLTSAIGLERAFEAELVRLFAQHRVNASFPLILLAVAITGASVLWVPVGSAGIWFVLVSCAICLMRMLALRFLGAETGEVRLRAWRARFVIAELIQGTAWAAGLVPLTKVAGPGLESFILFVALMVPAVTAMLSATIPIAVYAGLAPLSVMVACFAWMSAASPPPCSPSWRPAPTCSSCCSPTGSTAAP